MPDPAILKVGYPVKSMLVLEEIIVLGNDRGELKLIDKFTHFLELATLVCCDDPVIGIEEKHGLLLVHHKDGTIFIIQYTKTGVESWTLKQIGKVETKYEGPCAFTSTIACEIKEDKVIPHILIITPWLEKPNHLKVWVLDAANEKV